MAELATCRILADALAGRSRSEDYIAYLTNVFHYARFSPVIMAAAASRTSQSHPELSLYLLKHAGEEQGHDVWALEDLARLGVSGETVRQARPVPACAALVGYVHNLATAKNPIATFGWMYVLEAVGADIGVAAGAKLGATHSSGEDAPIRFVAGHGEADTDHTIQITAQIEAHVQDASDREDVCEAARVVSFLYTTMFRQIGGETARWQSP
jgi:pyrroloquinoline quinone (PQQ) biosynthesis protein C